MCEFKLKVTVNIGSTRCVEKCDRKICGVTQISPNIYTVYPLHVRQLNWYQQAGTQIGLEIQDIYTYFKTCTVNLLLHCTLPTAEFEILV